VEDKNQRRDDKVRSRGSCVVNGVIQSEGCKHRGLNKHTEKKKNWEQRKRVKHFSSQKCSTSAAPG
jgi:hypothetical protein